MATKKERKEQHYIERLLLVGNGEAENRGKCRRCDAGVATATITQIMSLILSSPQSTLGIMYVQILYR